jgi:hypothetical protein
MGSENIYREFVNVPSKSGEFRKLRPTRGRWTRRRWARDTLSQEVTRPSGPGDRSRWTKVHQSAVAASLPKTITWAPFSSLHRSTEPHSYSLNHGSTFRWLILASIITMKLPSQVAPTSSDKNHITCDKLCSRFRTPEKAWVSDIKGNVSSCTRFPQPWIYFSPTMMFDKLLLQPLQANHCIGFQQCLQESSIRKQPPSGSFRRVKIQSKQWRLLSGTISVATRVEYVEGMSRRNMIRSSRRMYFPT